MLSLNILWMNLGQIKPSFIGIEHVFECLQGVPIIQFNFKFYLSIFYYSVSIDQSNQHLHYRKCKTILYSFTVSIIHLNSYQFIFQLLFIYLLFKLDVLINYKLCFYNSKNHISKLIPLRHCKPTTIMLSFCMDYYKCLLFFFI